MPYFEWRVHDHLVGGNQLFAAHNMAHPNKVAKKGPPPKLPKSLKRKRVAEDLPALESRVQTLDVKDPIDHFSKLPLSQPTSDGLSSSHFKTLTDIQQRAIPLALQGHDILGAAKTGSGKTLAFLIPVLENLYRKKWTEYDGLGALILSPTRELAIQIFEVLRKIGRYHTFSAGLVIGGKSLQDEQERLGRMNILVCTPGRMLQHLDQTAAFEIGHLQMLVLDEADRILDMGFQGTVDAIVEHLPKERQTMLFSATQTKKVSDLARLSLQDPEYVSVHEGAASATPSTLKQHYIVTPLPDKLDTLWSFIRANLKAKILVFFSSGKQVQYAYESFRHMRPGISLLHLLGRQKQGARMDITAKFAATQNACLFATDVVARGLDFPAVDWVIQLDCPEDADTYIHRVGRTARFEREGRAVLFLDPLEEAGMLERLKTKNVPIEMIKVREKKQQSIRSQLQNMCFKDPELKYLGQKAFISYAKSVYVQKDKEIFKLQELPLEEYAASLGLPGAPKIKFNNMGQKSQKKAQIYNISSSESDNEEEVEARENGKKGGVRTKYDRMFERKNQDVLASHHTNLIASDSSSDSEPDTPTSPSHRHPSEQQANGEEDDFLAVKRRLSVSSTSSASSNDMKTAVSAPSQDPFIVDSARRAKMLTSKKAMLRFKPLGTKLVFDEAGAAHSAYEMQDENTFRAAGPADQQRREFVDKEGRKVAEGDIVDKKLAKEKKKEKERKRRQREREEMELDQDMEDEDGGVQLAPFEPDDSREAEADEAPEIPKKKRKKEKRQKKWFEDASDEEPSGARRNPDQVDTLEELEALATSYL